MFEFAALAYGVLASFIMSSASRNRREVRGHSAVLHAFGWGMMSFSAAAAMMILSYLAWTSLSGGAATVPPIA